MASPLISSLESLKIPTSEASPAQIQNGNFLNKLETMMSAVKKEAAGLENMKTKIKDMEDLKIRHGDLKLRFSGLESENYELRKVIKDSETQNNEIRTDMQRLNDIYNADRIKHIDMQQQALRLEQELSGARLEKDFFAKEAQKIPELKKTAKGLKAQIVQLKQLQEDESNALMAKMQEMEQRVFAAEKSKEEAAAHFWNLTEELNASKKATEASQQAAADMAKEVVEAKRVAALHRDRVSMVAEDLQHTRVRHGLYSRTHKADLHALQFENQNLKLSVLAKDGELADLSASVAQLTESSRADLTKLNGAAGKLQDTVKELSGKNQELVKENSLLKTKLAAKSGDLKKCIDEIEKLRDASSNAEQAAALRDSEAAQNMKLVTNQRDDATFKLQSTTAQFEALQAQAKSEQARHWEEVERLKNAESQLLEECDKLTQELSEKTVRLHALETEKAATENNMRVEVSGASNMVNALRDELEKRLEDLVNIRRERDGLADERDALSRLAEELRGEGAKNEALFKKTVEGLNSKHKSEAASRIHRIKTLETEKQEMLSEMNGLVKQITDGQRESETLRNEAEDSRQRCDKLGEQMDWVKTKNNDLLAEIKNAAKVEQDLRDKSFTAESRLKEEVARLNTLVSDTKKASGVQIIELNGQLKSNYDEIEELKRSILTYNDSEKKANIECDRLRSQLDSLTRQHEDSHGQQAAELNGMRRELGELRTKSKLAAESRTKVEMEVISARTDLSRAEAEISRQVEMYRDLEATCGGLSDRYKQAQAALEGLSDGSNKLKLRVVELEEVIKGKNLQLEHMQADMQQADRDGFQETKRLRMQLNSAESEISECRPLIPMLQKELADAKTNFAKLQTNSNVQLNALLQELAAAEDKLHAEKKRTEAVAAESTTKVTGLQLQLDKKRDQVEEMLNKTRAEKGDKELAVMALESEIERCKTIIADKDRTAEELQKQHQSDRVKIMELKGKFDEQERELIDTRGKLEMEEQQRKRCEARLRQHISTGEHAAVVRGEFASSSPGPQAGSTFTFENGNVGGYQSARNTFSRGGERERIPAYPTQRGESRDGGSRQPAAASDHDDNNSYAGSTTSGYRAGGASYDSRMGGGAAATAESYYTAYNSSSYVHPSEDDYRATTPSRRSSVQQEPSMRGSQSVPGLYNDGVPVSMRSPSGIHHQGEGHRSPFGSPRAGDKYQSSAQSPAAERVHATLVARTTAESSKNALKLAQQQRNAERQISSVAASNQAMLQQQQQYQALRKSSSQAAPSHDPYYDEVPAHGNGSTGSSWSEAPVAAIGAAGGGDSKLSAAQESIQRTQQLLNRRAEKSSGSFSSRAQLDNDLEASSSSTVITGEGKTPTSGRSSMKLSETIQHAHSMYPSEQADRDSHRASAVTPMTSAFSIPTPALQPASPPGGGSALRYNAGGSGSQLSELHIPSIEYEEEDDDEEPTGATLGSAVSKGGAKRVKKKKAKKSDAELQLPRLSSSTLGAAKRK